MRVNEFDQPIGGPVPDWDPRPPAGPAVLTGRTVSLEPLAHEHIPDLYRALVQGSPASLWTYVSAGPFTDRGGFEEYVGALIANPARAAMAVVVDGVALGHECYQRIDPAMGSVEIGSIVLGTALQRTTATTEAAYLLARHAFDDLGYRRYEWKCDSLNAASRRAAERLGFTPEGTFRNAVVYKGRNRDTDWFSITAEEWPERRQAFEDWLDPANFDSRGNQRRHLGS